MDFASMNPSKLISSTISPPPPLSLAKYESKISPSILLIIVILSVIFFISGILHLLVRFLLRPTIREAENSENGTVLQGQLQDLFHLHDAGVDQSFIDTLPLFLYKAIIGLKEPFDCAVCLSEFEPKDKLRLLPKCSHAFHVECIDTWLLSHSTCPLCRRSLFPDFSPVHNSLSPVLLLLDSGTESSRDFAPSNRFEAGESDSFGQKSDLFIKDDLNFGQKSDLFIKDELSSGSLRFQDENIVSVKLGKFRNVDVGRVGEGCSNDSRNLEQSQRRCFSMGSYDYMMDERCVLQVSLNSMKKKKRNLLKRESFSASKIWLQAKSGDLKKKEEWEKSKSEVDLDLENSFCSQIEETPSFARRTMMWIVGRQNKVGSNQ